MPILNPEKFAKEKIECDGDEYLLTILRIAEYIMALIENLGEKEIDAKALVHEADRELKKGITGNMVGYVVMLVAKYHSRGEEFRKSWNKSWHRPEATGVINPAQVTIG